MSAPARLLTGLVFALMAPAVSADTIRPHDHPAPAFRASDRRARLTAAFPEVDDLMARQMAAAHVPGLVYGIMIDGELVFSRGLGARDRASQAPVDLDTVFRIASMTKSFTALAILKLRDEGRLSLDDPVSHHVPELASLAYPTRDSAPITIRQLLTHSEGFPEDNPWGDQQLAASEEVFSRWMRAGIPFSNPPGLEFEYSNYGFAILGRVVANVSHTRYRDYVDREILGPLGMTATYWDARAVPAQRLAAGYRWENDKWSPEPQLPDGAFGAMGGLLTSGRDLARYVAFHLSAWPARDDPETGPVRRSSMREMQQPWRPNSLRADRPAPDAPLRLAVGAYGYGLGVTQECQLRRTIAHGGGLPGFGSTMRWLPDHGVGVFVMANRTYAPAGNMARDAVDLLAHTGALEPRVLSPSRPLEETRDAILRLLARWDDAEARALAADNLFKDTSLESRRAEMERLRTAHGACRPGEVEPENWLRGRFRAECHRGWVDVSFTLAPTLPPRVQSLVLSGLLPLGEAMSRSVQAMTGLASAWTEEAASALFAPSVDRAALRGQLEATGRLYGACRPGRLLGGNGGTQARLRLECDRGPVVASLAAEEDGKLTSVTFSSPPDATCVP